MELSQTCKIEPFAKIDNGFQPLATFAKTSVLDVLLGSKCAWYANISAMIEVGHSLNKPAVGINSKKWHFLDQKYRHWNCMVNLL